uniref:Uncharacterized protein n=1 Tax=viral metagenome TaxID=1070528 RepID=A0A6C0JQK7_9ZZZZ
MAEKKFNDTILIFSELKTVLYSIVESYRKLIHIAQNDNTKLEKLCKLTSAMVDEKGKLVYTQKMLSNVSDKIISKSIKESEYFMVFFYNVDVFINFLTSLKSIKSIINYNNPTLMIIIETWLGDRYNVKKDEALKILIKELRNEQMNITKHVSRELYSDLSEEHLKIEEYNDREEYNDHEDTEL